MGRGGVDNEIGLGVVSPYVADAACAVLIGLGFGLGGDLRVGGYGGPGMPGRYGIAGLCVGGVLHFSFEFALSALGGATNLTCGHIVRLHGSMREGRNGFTLGRGVRVNGRYGGR